MPPIMETLSLPSPPISTSNELRPTQKRPRGEEQKRGKGKQEGMAANAALAGRGKKLALILLYVLLLLAVRPRRGAAAVAGTCNGSVAAGCPLGGGGAGVEWQRETETNRRVLAGYGGGHIVYGALGRQACEKPPGGAYTQGHGCLSQRVNPHTRPCLTIYKCRS